MKQRLLEIIARGAPYNAAELHTVFEDIQTVDIAEVIDELDSAATVRLFRLLPKNRAANVFAYLSTEQQQVLIEAMTDKEVGTIMNDLFADDATDIIEEMPASIVKRLLRTTDPEKRKAINNLLLYPEGSAGSVMTVEYIKLKPNDTVAAAFQKIRATGIDKETIYKGFIVDTNRVLIGTVTARALMLADPTQTIGELMDDNCLTANTLDTSEHVAQLFRRYRLNSLPVTDSEKRLVGIITVDDVLEIMQEEATEDIEKMAALKPLENTYLKTGVFKQAGNRITWLCFLMISAILTGLVITAFETKISTSIVLVTFIPMLMGTGGNAGSQAATLVIRGMAVGELRARDFGRIWLKEVRIAIICGVVLGAINFLRVFFLGPGRGEALLALTVTISLCVVVIIAKSVGCLLPVIAKKCRLDPAIMAAPLISTIIDTLALLTYFGVATLILGI